MPSRVSFSAAASTAGALPLRRAQAVALSDGVRTPEPDDPPSGPEPPPPPAIDPDPDPDDPTGEPLPAGDPPSREPPQRASSSQ